MASPKPMLEIDPKVEFGKVERMLRRIEAKGKRPPLGWIGLVGVRSIRRNFHEGGRPERWEPLEESTIKSRGGGDQPLRNKSQLRASFHHRIVGNNNVRIGTDLESPKEYPFPVALHFGVRNPPAGKSMIRSREWYLPPRPMALWQDEDIMLIQRGLQAHLLGERLPKYGQARHGGD